jgi:hypothetical protein
MVPGAPATAPAMKSRSAGDSVVRVELDNGFVLWSRVDDLTREYGALPSRDAGGAWEFSRLAPRRVVSDDRGGERGIVGLGIRVLEFFGVNLVEKSARKLGIVFEQKILGDHPPGLYRLDMAGKFQADAGA